MVLRKGQFFIIGAIVVALSLFALSESLERNPAFDPSFVQEDDIGARYMKIEELLDSTVVMSDHINRDRDLRHLEHLLQEEFSSDNYRIELEYNEPDVLPLDISTSLASPDNTINKTREYGA